MYDLLLFQIAKAEEDLPRDVLNLFLVKVLTLFDKRRQRIVAAELQDHVIVIIVAEGFDKLADVLVFKLLVDPNLGIELLLVLITLTLLLGCDLDGVLLVSRHIDALENLREAAAAEAVNNAIHSATVL